MCNMSGRDAISQVLDPFQSVLQDNFWSIPTPSVLKWQMDDPLIRGTTKSLADKWMGFSWALVEGDTFGD